MDLHPSPSCQDVALVGWGHGPIRAVDPISEVLRTHEQRALPALLFVRGYDGSVQASKHTILSSFPTPMSQGPNEAFEQLPATKAGVSNTERRFEQHGALIPYPPDTLRNGSP